MVELNCMNTHAQVRSIEKLIAPFGGVGDVVVISVPQPSGGNHFNAFVEPDEKSLLSVEKITDYLKNSEYKDIPVSVVFCKIPRTPSGKAARQALLDMCAG